MCSDDIQILLGNSESTSHVPRVQNLKITSEFLDPEQAVSDFISIEDYHLFLERNTPVPNSQGLPSPL